ncbi:hypothetical protein BD311DRAFT_753101 [Dichomitus squalens]|uniref:Uncharacterized protein n=1 Tax=Dichomitus squalens TaxID=114155 RepID=A0A4Q9MTT8_9APHY|nr:hypothetical protein BD311DRAFT_753101 [Dichomitus squalens]
MCSRILLCVDSLVIAGSAISPTTVLYVRTRPLARRMCTRYPTRLIATCHLSSWLTADAVGVDAHQPSKSVTLPHTMRRCGCNPRIMSQHMKRI